jgi:HD superfamily phosphohydrolase
VSKRLRDPVYGLIVFDVEDKPIDCLAWRLIDTPEFQRLRRIRQLGVSEFTFPSAVHTRFAHSIGVFHIARMLVEVIRREMTRNGGETVANYLALDDMLFIGSLEAMARSADPAIGAMATRLRERNLYKTLDLAEFGADRGKQSQRRRRIERDFKDQLSQGTVILDDKAAIGIYSEIGGDEERMHKRLHILDGNTPTEISKLSPLIKALEAKKPFTRFYFAEKADRDKGRGTGGKG